MKIKELILTGIIVVLLVGCSGGAEEATTPETAVPTLQPTEEVDEAPAANEEVESVDMEITAVSFDLGDSIIEQEWVANENFRDLPIRLQGMIAVPPTGDNLPIAIIIHGSHGSGCESDEQGLVEFWPCPEDELHHYEGFAYLAEALAEQGYVAVSINANPAFVSAFSNPNSSLRLPLLFDQYLAQIAAAGAGESVDLGVDLSGRVDWNQLVILGHSQGGEGVYALVNGRSDHTSPEEIEAGQGPITAAIMLAPANTYGPKDDAVAAPFTVILPACDRDLTSLDGQTFYETARLAAERTDLAASVYLEGANHNRFNAMLEDETIGRERSVCQDALLPAADQQAFLTEYALHFFDAVLGRGEGDTAVIGLAPTQPASGTLLGLPVLTSLALPAEQRLTLPLSEDGVNGAATAVFCEQGYSLAEEKMEPCRRYQFNQPGYPVALMLTWEDSGDVYDVMLPEGNQDMSAYDVLHLRTAVDPVNEFNAAGEPQSFSVQLTDGNGETAVVTLADEPALAFPAGEKGFDDFFEVDTWDNHVILSSVRIPLAQFSGIDLTDVQTISLVFDATDSGAIFLADLELLQTD